MRRLIIAMSQCIIGSACREWFLPQRGLPSGFPPCELAGVSELRPPYRMSRPIPGFRLVLATWGGHGRLADGRRLATGDVLIADPHEAHDYRIDAARWHIAWLHLDRRWGGLGQGTRIR
ncbi:MAG TPA: hypothetical protein DCS97_11020, partial [Planctomycetes bacterium]|nr:hypothetical protein [Planctomycetota bacterium]